MQTTSEPGTFLDEERSRSMYYISGMFAAMSLLVEMGWIALLACVSMTAIAQRKPHNHPYRQHLFLYGLMWGALFALLGSWSFLYMPVFAILAGILNSNLPYGHYVTEITRYTDWAYRV